MANPQIKGIEEGLYAQIKATAQEENRSLSQQILYLAKAYLVKRKKIRTAKTPAQVLPELSGSWADDRPAEEIIQSLRKSRRNSQQLKKGG